MGLVKKEKGKNWYYQFEYIDANGRKRGKSINTNVPKNHTSKREMSRAEAIGVQAKNEFLCELENEKLRVVGIKDGIDYSVYTIADYSAHWMDEIRHEVRDSTASSYQQELNAHIIPILGEVKLKDFNLNTVKYFFDLEFNDCLDKMKNNKSNYMQSIKKHLNTLSSMLDFAVEENAIIENPVPKIKKRLLKKVNKYKVVHEVEPYSWSELMALKEITLASNTHIEAAVIIAIYTGLRREEVLGLRWQDVDFDNRLLRIQNTCSKVGTKIVYAEATKTRQSRRKVPMMDDLYDYLLALRDRQNHLRNFLGEGYIDTDLICVWDDGKPIKPDNLSRRFTKLIEDNNLRKITFHDLRHSFGSVIFNYTGDIKVVSDLLGHSNISTTSDIYVKTDEMHKKEALSNFNNQSGAIK